MNENVKIVEKLSDAFGASGYEYEVIESIYDDMKDFGDVEIDAINNFIIKRQVNDGVKFLFDAHLDEVAFMVKNILNNGMLEIIPTAGWVASNVPAHKWKVRNAKGEYITGITTSKPPHYMTDEERKKSITFDSIYVDLGISSKEEAIEKFNIRIGEPVVPDVKFEYDEDNDIMIGKAFDCRVGCASMVLTAQEIMKKNIDVNVTCAFTAQEEIGTRGSTVASKKIDADFAIVFEGAPADDTFSDYSQTAIGKGPMLRHLDAGMLTHPGFQDFALGIAKKYNIKVQDGVRSGGSTNGKHYNLSKNAIPTIVIGVPVRHAHTHYSISKFEDIESAVKLAIKIIEDFDKDKILNYGFTKKIK